MYDQNGASFLTNTKYTLVGESTGKQIDGSTDGNGTIFHEFLPDDHYMIRCGKGVEPVQAYYMSDQERRNGDPSFIRLRAVDHQENGED